MYLIWACVQVLKTFEFGMRRNSGPARNPILCHYSPCARPNRGRLIGGPLLRTDACGSVYIDKVGPARALKAHCKSRRMLSHAPQTRFHEIARRLRDPAHSIACKHLPMPPPLPRLRSSDLSVGQPFRRYRAPKKEKKCLQADRIGYFSRERKLRSPF